MVAHLVRLRLALLLASVRPGARERPRLVAGLVFVVLGVAAAWAGLLALRTTSDVAAQAVTVVGGAAVALGFLAAPLAVGGQDQLDPRRFRPFGATSGPLAAGVAVASLVSVPMLALIVVAVGVGTLWSTSDAGAAMVAGPALGVMTTVLLARIGWAGSTRVLRGHRSRELSGLFLVALLVVVVPVGVFFASFAWQGGVPSGLLGAVRLVSFTPLGAGWALPGAAATGDPLLWLVALLAVAWPVSLATIWYAVVDRMLHAPDRPASSRLRSGMSWFAVMPATPAGAIAARSLIYWLGDRRYRVNVVIVPVAALLTAVPLLIAGVPAEIVTLVPLPIAALFLGLAAAQRRGLRRDRRLAAHRQRCPRNLRSCRTSRAGSVRRRARDRRPRAGDGDAERTLGVRAGDHRRVHLAVPERSRAVLCRLRGGSLPCLPSG
ncbi:hypothetical protein [Microbacterium sp. SORGH_AS_0888]|uniref:hypothetical protein n=1 Tax=Microbacterium sp. SORGH_AS_0888 TaxID=3041791 RepID=UPI00277E5CF6|nr:hypothetical protein [Microbacterium sp. SORGH_AS_0888]MDQ1128228.1 hypothetical protein [Microbacterium sp. SORGH_AS_0888]